MPEPRSAGDPYSVLNVDPHASDATIKRRWRELAREHHPDRAAGDRTEATRLTDRMARINAAYDLLRDPQARARFDGSPEGRRARERGRARKSEESARGFAERAARDEPAGPPPPPPAPPVTARFDTTAAYRPRNATTSGRTTLRGHPPIDRRTWEVGREPLRASTPTGPVHREETAERPRMPSLREARETEIDFGKFRGYTLGEVALLEPTYVEWIARTITRDRDLVLRARVIRDDLERQGLGRGMREPATAGAASARPGGPAPD